MNGARESALITHHYVPGKWGEVHLRRLDVPNGSGAPLVCLHPAPHSGLYFTTLMPMITAATAVVAPDYPGYGGSRAPLELPDIAAYAGPMLEVVEAVSDRPVNLLGFHTGCLVALEMAIQQPEKIGRLVLVDVPFFSGTERTAVYAEAAQSPGYSAAATSLAASFNSTVSKRLDHVDYDRAFDLFAEQLRSGNRSHWAFHAAFSYDAENAFAKSTAPGIIIATGSRLLEPTRQAAELLPGLRLIERPDIMRSVFEEGAAGIAAELNSCLSA